MLRSHFVDAPDSWAARLRARRWRWLSEIFPDLHQMSVIDIGGSIESWKRTPIHPKHVHVVNIAEQPSELPDWAEVDRADACDLPARIRSRRYDLAFSNSVIEHIGGHERRLRFAETIQRLADAYWVQTPYRYFPVEPHWIAPGLQYLPLALRCRVAHHWPLVHSRPKTRQDALDSLLWVELLDRTQMRYYFPDGQLRAERLLGIPKSLIAVRRVPSPPP